MMMVLVTAALALLRAAGADSTAPTPESALDVRVAQFETFADAVAALGSAELRAFRDRRLPGLEAALGPIAAALPSSGDGLLGSTAVGYSLYRLFLKRHGLLVKGLDPQGKAFNGTSPSQAAILSEAPGDIRAALVHQLSKEGLPLQDVAVLAALVEFLLERRSLRMLQAVYKRLGLTTVGSVSFYKVERALDLQLAAYISGQDPEKVTSRLLEKVERQIPKVYPNWPQLQAQVHKVMHKQVPADRKVTFAEARSVLEEVSQNFGRWQEPECMDLKRTLMQLEESGSGRVRLRDFYGTAQHQGKWQFMESVTYLKELGALDETDPNDVKVIIPNYVGGASNCIASSPFSSVCCISECESLREDIEQALGVPEAPVEDVARVAAALPSSTVPANHSLSPLMLNRLYGIAAAHGGRVPLYGRLFAQWLHHLFPRECPYPHMSGTTRPLALMDYKKQRNLKPTLTKAELKRWGGQAPSGHAQRSRPLVTSPWSRDEEFLVPPSSAFEEIPTGFFQIQGMVIAVLTAIIAFGRVLLGMARLARKGLRADDATAKRRHGTLPAEACLKV